MNKSPDAFRTISEVAEILETPAHVLRFWESRFPQIRPVKRAGGRRYYRPADVALLTGIKRLLHDEGMTIRGVQKVLREQGVRFVSGVPDDATEADDDAALAAALALSSGRPDAEPNLPPAEAETAQIIALQSALRDSGPDSTPDIVTEEDWRVEDPTDAASLPEDVVSDAPAPPAPVVAFPAPPVPPPEPADLFSRLTPPAQGVAEEQPKSKPPAPVAEAPMEIWAEEDANGDDASDSPAINVTRIGQAPLAQTEPAPPPAPPREAAHHEPADPGPTLAQRLRARRAASTTPAERAQFAQIRDQAAALRARLSGSGRTPF
jgi:resuscitation-promoting factor RpfA